MNMISVNRIM